MAIMAVAGLIALVSLVVFALPEVSAVFDEETVDAGSSMFMLFCSLLVMIMSPAVALFYGGMLRKQSMTSTIAQCLGVMAVMGVIWWVVGYSLVAGGDGAFIGNFDFIFGKDLSISVGDPEGPAIPTIEFFIFQGMFAMLTACLIFGATAERMRYSAVLAFIVLWSVLVYAPMAHMVWFGGFLSDGITELGFPAQDFAGGTVVHMCSAVTGVACAIVVGKRCDRIAKGRTHNVPLMFIGAVLLWIGWFGFNCGSEGGFDDIVMLALVNTFVASVLSTVTWIIVQYLHVGRVNVTGLCAGLLAGLVGVTPGCGFVDPWAAAVIGIISAVVVYFGIIFMRNKSGIDDALDVMGVHGVGGIWGCIAVGIFSVGEYCWVGTGGLIEGQWDMLIGQLVNVVVTLGYCFVVSFVIIKLIDIVMKKTVGKGVRLSDEEQMIGSDIIEHGEPSYLM